MDNVRISENEFEYNFRNITIYYEEGFDIKYLQHEDKLIILHQSEDCFQVINNHDIILDYVLIYVIEFNGDKKIKAIAELGMEDCFAGYQTQLLLPNEKFVLFCSAYEDEKKKNSDLSS